MTGIYGFWGGPTYRATTREERLSASLDMPMSLGATFWDQAKGGVLESFGLGTAIRTLSLPPAAQTRRGRETDAEYQARQERVKGITEEEYKASPYYRDGVPWDSGMTEDRAAALATMYDAKRVREYFAEKRPITAFFGNLAGQATDPINYIPVAGPSVRAAAVARMGLVKGVAATAALDAAANTAIAGLATRETRRGFGDDVSWQAMISEIATAALIGSAFGTVGGVLERRAGLMADALRAEAEVKVQTLKATQEARIALNEAIGGLATDGEVRLSPNATAPIERVANETGGRGEDFSRPVVELPEFKSWFGDSKIVDEGGSPQVAYHGTGASFDQFKVDTVGTAMDAGKLGRGFYFSTRPDVAGGYANATQAKGGSPNVMPVYLAVENPLVFDQTKGGSIWTRLREKSKEWGIELDPMKDEVTAEPNDAWAYAFSEVAQEKGFDGVVMKMRDGDEIAVFNPTQIKSVFNRGAFSRQDPRVIDTSPARADPIPEGRAEAEAKVAKPENYKALADQYRVDPETGAFPEEAELRQLAQEGRLSDEDAAVLDDADAAYQDGAAFGEALRSVVGCLV